MSRFSFFGPGILLAATSIGVSHLVQSVQAGAKYGFLFIAAIILAHLIKYPFFEAATRYSSVTKKTLLDGYYKLNHKYLFIYLIITLISGIIIIVAVSVVAGGLLANIFININLSIQIWASIMLVFCYCVLLIGKYDFLDHIVKPIILILVISTLIAVFYLYRINILQINVNFLNTDSFSFLNKGDIIFLIAFLGWMPCPLDCTIWNSIWIVEKNHKQKITPSQSLLDFRVGFIITAILAILFLLLGSFSFYEKTTLSGKAIVFLGQFLDSYRKLGNEVFYLILISSFIAMFSTVMTCLDGTPRVFTRTFEIIKKNYLPDKHHNISHNKIYSVCLTISLILGLLIVNLLFSNMRTLIFIATITAFLSTPIIGFLNIKLLQKENYDPIYKPSKIFFYYSYFSIVILVLFSILFIVSRFFN